MPYSNGFDHYSLSVSKCTESLNLTSRTGQYPVHINVQSTSTRQHTSILNTRTILYLAMSLLVRDGDSTASECDDEDEAVKKPNRGKVSIGRT